MPMLIDPVTFDPLMGVHSPSACLGRYCVLHNPDPDQPLYGAPLDWNPKTAVMSRVCEHGKRHPDSDDAEFRIATHRASSEKSAYEHNCDGCCEDYPHTPAGKGAVYKDWVVLGFCPDKSEAQKIAASMGWSPSQWYYDEETANVMVIRGIDSK